MSADQEFDMVDMLLYIGSKNKKMSDKVAYFISYPLFLNDI